MKGAKEEVEIILQIDEEHANERGEQLVNAKLLASRSEGRLYIL